MTQLVLYKACNTGCRPSSKKAGVNILGAFDNIEAIKAFVADKYNGKPPKESLYVVPVGELTTISESELMHQNTIRRQSTISDIVLIYEEHRKDSRDTFKTLTGGKGNEGDLATIDELRQRYKGINFDKYVTKEDVEAQQEAENESNVEKTAEVDGDEEEEEEFKDDEDEEETTEKTSDVIEVTVENEEEGVTVEDEKDVTVENEEEDVTVEDEKSVTIEDDNDGFEIVEVDNIPSPSEHKKQDVEVDPPIDDYSNKQAVVMRVFLDLRHPQDYNGTKETVFSIEYCGTFESLRSSMTKGDIGKKFPDDTLELIPCGEWFFPGYPTSNGNAKVTFHENCEVGKFIRKRQEEERNKPMVKRIG